MSWTTPRTWVAAEILTAALMNTHVRDNLNFLKANIALAPAVELTIDTGAITPSQSHHTVDTEADAASDDLDAINGGSEGNVLFIRPASGARTVVLKHGTGNIWNPNGADVTLDDADDFALLIYGGTNWCIVAGGSASDLAAHVAAVDPHTGYVLESLFDANTILKADSDNTPAALSVTEQTLVGRLTGGNIAAVAIGLSNDNIPQVDDADGIADNDYVKATAAGLEGRTYAEVRSDINVEDGADVTDATNVEAAGAVMETDTTTADMDFVIDEDDMASDLATKVPTQQSVKAYVDAEVAAGGGGVFDGGLITDTNTTIVAFELGNVERTQIRFTSGSAFPSTPNYGDVHYKTSDSLIYMYVGGL